MTHPADHIYRFSDLRHWGRGYAVGLELSGNGNLSTPVPKAANLVHPVSPGTRLILLSRDLCGRLIWLQSDGAVRVLDDGKALQIAKISAELATEATRLIWGQEIAWIVSGGKLVRLDARTGDRMGIFNRDGWSAEDAVIDRCDGVIVAETRPGAGVVLRQVLPDGSARTLQVLNDLKKLAAMSRWGTNGDLLLVSQDQSVWSVLKVAQTSGKTEADGLVKSSLTLVLDKQSIPSRAVAMDAPKRQIFITPDKAGIFSIANGLVEPVQRFKPVSGMGALEDISWSGDALYVATARGVYALDADEENGPALTATYITPALHSPSGMRSGWQRADVRTVLPKAARVTIRSQSIADPDAFNKALRETPTAEFLDTGWNEQKASTHFGAGASEMLRHYLGDQTAEWLALRIDISTSVCSPPVLITALDVLYPNRSLIEDLPAIYRTRDGSEAQLRRMLAPFQALADEIDDLIGERLRKLDPEKTDDLWAGFLLGWLGHRRFARLPGPQRRALLKVLPEALQWRGTLGGLARVLDVLAPEGFAIEDAALGPDVWVLPNPVDPAGARLGSETRVVKGMSDGLRLGCDTLGDGHLGRICLDPLEAAKTCSGEVTIRIFGGDSAKARISPFTDRIIRDFLPAHTKARFVFGAHEPPETLGRSRPTNGTESDDHLMTLDLGRDRRIGAWRLPDGRARIVHDEPQDLKSAVLDGTFVLG